MNADTLWLSDSQLRIIIHNVFAFLHHIHKICLKKGKFCLKKRVKTKKKVCWQYHLKSDL